MYQFPSYQELRPLIELSRDEDLRGDDVTSRLMVPEGAVGVGTLMQREVGVACGLPVVEMVCRAYDERLRVEMIPGFHMEVIEGRYSDARQTPLLRVRGPMRALLWGITLRPSAENSRYRPSRTSSHARHGKGLFSRRARPPRSHSGGRR